MNALSHKVLEPKSHPLLNVPMLVSRVMIDNFLPDPLPARRQALALEYDSALKNGNYPGLVSGAPLRFAGLDERVSAAIGGARRGGAGDAA